MVGPASFQLPIVESNHVRRLSPLQDAAGAAIGTSRVFYISYDGALEPLGESQVVSYLERLAERVAITLLTFEKRSDLAEASRVAVMRQRLEGAGITWIPRPYHKRPAVLSTVYDVWAGCRAGREWSRSLRRGSISIVHARGYVSALIALYVKRDRRIRFMFDMRGFWVDEKVEAGHWRRGGFLYRLGKWCERRFIDAADAIVSLTEAGVAEIPRLGRVRPGVPLVVIPTCADLDRFQPGRVDESRRRALGLEGAFVVGYVGTMSNWYLREDTLRYLAAMARRFPRMKALIVTREDPARLLADAARVGLAPDRLVLTRASFDEMPALMRLMDISVFFIRVCFAKRASAATKLAELLGCGVPVVINDGIGDSGAIVRSDDVGVVLAGTSDAEFAASFERLTRLLEDPDASARCRRTAQQRFSLAEGARRYAALYDRLIQENGKT